MLAKRNLNSIETLVSQALIDLETSHGEFKIIVNEKEKYNKNACYFQRNKPKRYCRSNHR